MTIRERLRSLNDLELGALAYQALGETKLPPTQTKIDMFITDTTECELGEEAIKIALSACLLTHHYPMRQVAQLGADVRRFGLDNTAALMQSCSDTIAALNTDRKLWREFAVVVSRTITAEQAASMDDITLRCRALDREMEYVSATSGEAALAGGDRVKWQARAEFAEHFMDELCAALGAPRDLHRACTMARRAAGSVAPAPLVNGCRVYVMRGPAAGKTGVLLDVNSHGTAHLIFDDGAIVQGTIKITDLRHE